MTTMQTPSIVTDPKIAYGGVDHEVVPLFRVIHPMGTPLPRDEILNRSQLPKAVEKIITYKFEVPYWGQHLDISKWMAGRWSLWHPDFHLSNWYEVDDYVPISKSEAHKNEASHSEFPYLMTSNFNDFVEPLVEELEYYSSNYELERHIGSWVMNLFQCLNDSWNHKVEHHSHKDFIRYANRGLRVHPIYPGWDETLVKKPPKMASNKFGFPARPWRYQDLREAPTKVEPIEVFVHNKSYYNPPIRVKIDRALGTARFPKTRRYCRLLKTYYRYFQDLLRLCKLTRRKTSSSLKKTIWKMVSFLPYNSSNYKFQPCKIKDLPSWLRRIVTRALHG